MRRDWLRLKKRSDEETSGPWWVDYLESDPDYVNGILAIHNFDEEKEIVNLDYYLGFSPVEPVDAEFIANARSDIPFLLDCIENLEAENARLREKIEGDKK